MANIRRYTTPTQELLVEGVDLTSAEVFVSYRQKNTSFVFSGNQIQVEAITEDERTDTLISVYMTQEQTASFKYNEDVEIQVNWLEGHRRNATVIARCKVSDNLLEEVINL